MSLEETFAFAPMQGFLANRVKAASLFRRLGNLGSQISEQEFKSMKLRAHFTSLLVLDTKSWQENLMMYYKTIHGMVVLVGCRYIMPQNCMLHSNSNHKMKFCVMSPSLG